MRKPVQLVLMGMLGRMLVSTDAGNTIGNADTAAPSAY
jgi:hypothetical protein